MESNKLRLRSQVTDEERKCSSEVIFYCFLSFKFVKFGENSIFVLNFQQEKKTKLDKTLLPVLKYNGRINYSTDFIECALFCDKLM